MTIVYLKLKNCGNAYGSFERILGDKQYVGETSEPTARLFARFHAPQTSRMKKDILSGIKNENSRMRVLFATSALGMGVHAPHVVNIIHITPPSSLEAYIQKIGRAGRTGLSSYATLYYNNYDIGNNMKHDNYISNKEEISKAWGKMFFFNSKWNKLAIDMIKNGKDKKGKYVSDKVKNILNKSEHKGLLFPCY